MLDEAVAVPTTGEPPVAAAAAEEADDTLELADIMRSGSSRLVSLLRVAGRVDEHSVDKLDDQHKPLKCEDMVIHLHEQLRCSRGCQPAGS